MSKSSSTTSRRRPPVAAKTEASTPSTSPPKVPLTGLERAGLEGLREAARTRQYESARWSADQARTTPISWSDVSGINMCLDDARKGLLAAFGSSDEADDEMRDGLALAAHSLTVIQKTVTEILHKIVDARDAENAR